MFYMKERNETSLPKALNGILISCESRYAQGEQAPRYNIF